MDHVAVEIRMESSSPLMAEPRKGSKALAGRVSRSATGKQRAMRRVSVEPPLNRDSMRRLGCAAVVLRFH